VRRHDVFLDASASNRTAIMGIGHALADIVGCGFVDVGRGDLRDRGGERDGENRSTSTRLDTQEYKGLSSSHKFRRSFVINGLLLTDRE
jgi:hypothetical protein